MLYMNLLDNNKIQKLAKKSLPSSIDRLSWTRAKLENYQLKKLKLILAYAKKYSPWYAHTLKNIELSSFTLKDLNKIPILTKDTFINHWDDIVTDRKLSLKYIQSIINQKCKNNTSYRITRSGGTSGKTGLYVFDRSAWINSFNSTIRALIHEKVIQNKINQTITRITLAAPFTTHMTSSLMIGAQSAVNDIYLPVTEPYDLILKKIQTHNIDILQGFPSMLSKIATSHLNGDIYITPSIIISMAEPLDAQTKTLLKKTWNVKIYDVWATGEFGPLGITCHSCDNIILNSDHCYFEYSFNKTIPPTSNTLLVTSLHNKVMPLIRYQVDDILEQSEPNTCCHSHFGVIGGIIGRPSDIFYYDNIIVHGYCIRMVFLKFPNILDYQIYQTQSGVAVHLNKKYQSQDNDIKKLCTMLKDNLCHLGLKNPTVKIKYVDKMKTTPAGKTQRLIALKEKK